MKVSQKSRITLFNLIRSPVPELFNFFLFLKTNFRGAILQQILIRVGLV